MWSQKWENLSQVNRITTVTNSLLRTVSYNGEPSSARWHNWSQMKDASVLFRKKIARQKSKQQLFIRDQYCHLAVMAPHSYCLFRLKWLDVTEPLISRQRLPNQPFYLFSANTPMIGLWSDLIGSFWLGPFVSVWNWKKNQSPGAEDLLTD